MSDMPLYADRNRENTFLKYDLLVCHANLYWQSISMIKSERDHEWLILLGQCKVLALVYTINGAPFDVKTGRGIRLPKRKKTDSWTDRWT